MSDPAILGNELEDDAIIMEDEAVVEDDADLKEEVATKIVKKPAEPIGDPLAL